MPRPISRFTARVYRKRSNRLFRIDPEESAASAGEAPHVAYDDEKVEPARGAPLELSFERALRRAQG